MINSCLGCCRALDCCCSSCDCNRAHSFKTRRYSHFLTHSTRTRTAFKSHPNRWLDSTHEASASAASSHPVRWRRGHSKRAIEEKGALIQEASATEAFARLAAPMSHCDGLRFSCSRTIAHWPCANSIPLQLQFGRCVRLFV